MKTPEAFNSENAEPNRSESAVLTFAKPTPVSLATLKRDGIQFDRAEAIATSQALCLALMTAQHRRRTNADSNGLSALPPVSTETVCIDPGSRLGMSVGEPGDEASTIQAVGRIMADIVPSDARPSLDSKIIAKALASPPQFETVGDLSQALAEFEQLEGRELIQAVYERWKKEDSAPVRPTAARFSDSTPGIRLGSQLKGVAAAVISISVLVMGVSAWFLMSRLDAGGSLIAATKDSTITVETAPLLEARPIAPVSTGLVTWSMARADRPALSMRLLSVIDAAPPVRTGRPPAVARIERPATSPPISLIARTESPVVVDVPTFQPRSDPAPTAPQLGRSVAGDATSVRRTSDVSRSSTGVATAMSPPADDGFRHAPARPAAVSNHFARPVTYTAGDAGVSPPIPNLPRLIASLQPSSPGISLGALAIAVVVDENGTAYSVTGINVPQTMGEYVMLTSALAVVKSWEFQPALKDGTPVRYRLIVPLREVTR